MRRPDVFPAFAGVLAVLILASCSRLSFVRPDAGRGDYRALSEPVKVRQESGGRAAVRGLTHLAQARLVEGDVAAAREAAERALRLDPKSADAHGLLALAFDAGGDTALAGLHHRKAVEFGPAQGGLLNNYGGWLCANGRAAESLAWFDRAIAAPGYGTPDDARANASACAMRAGQGERAEREARQVLVAFPAHPVALRTLAQRMAATRQWLDARAFIERRLAAAPADAESLLLASQIEHELGDTAAAARYGQRLRAEFPRNSAQEGGTP